MNKDHLKTDSILCKGYGIIPKAIMQDSRLSISAKALYSYFASFTGGGTNECFPSMSKIKCDLGISEDTIRKSLNQLKECGYIEVSQIKKKGKFSHNVYKLPYNNLSGTVKTDTENIGYGEIGTNNNSTNNNNTFNINNNNISPTQKRSYGEYKNVLLTDDEFAKLQNDYSNVDELIKYLDEYIEMKGYKAKSHYLCIKKWVVKAVEENKSKSMQGTCFEESKDYSIDLEMLTRRI